MKILLTGASGFVAPHLAEELASRGHDIQLTSLEPVVVHTSVGSLKSIPCDLRNKQEVSGLIKKIRPHTTVHLAAFSSVANSWTDRALLIESNVYATDHLCRALTSLGSKSTLLMISTAAIYGRTGKASRFNEQTLPHPNSPYAFSKLAAEMVAKAYSSEQFSVYVARPANHTGPGQSASMVCPAFAQRIALARDGSVIEVGDLAAKRDFSDVRDMVRAYRLIIENKPRERLFVLGSGKGTAAGQILEILKKISGKKIRHQVSSKFLRKVDSSYLTADTRLAQRVLGWRPHIDLQTTLAEIYEEAVSRGSASIGTSKPSARK